jgi:hypothetical protein
MSASFWLTLIITAVALLLTAEVGYAVGVRTPPDVAEAKKATVSVTVGAMLGLLALLLGFTFSMVDERYATRKAVLIDDANAIGTAYLRATLLPSPSAGRAMGALREIAEIKTHHLTKHAIVPTLQRVGELQRVVWQEVFAAAERDSHSQVTGQFIVAVNAMIDAQSARVDIALHQRLPPAIRFVLYLSALLSLAVVGFHTGLARRRAMFATVPLVIGIATVMTVIVELNRPVDGVGQLDLAPYSDLVEDMKQPPPRTAVQ